MFKTEDNYNLYYDGRVSKDQATSFKNLIEEYQLSSEITVLLEKHFNFRTYNTYSDHKKLIWILYKTLGSFAITILFAEEDHPHGCEYQARVDFIVDAGGNFDYEFKNSLFLYETQAPSDQCEERIAQKTFGFEKDCRIKGSLAGMDLEAFVRRIMNE